MSRRSRAGLAVPLVLVMLAIAGVGMMAIGRYRSSVTRQIDGLVQASRLVDAASAALSEAASGRRLNAMLADATQQQAFVQAFQQGTYQGGVLIPAPLDFLVEPDTVRSYLGADGTVTLGAVRVRPVRYLPGTNRGILRMAVEAEVRGAVRTYRRSLAHDYEFSVVPTTAGFVLRIARDPRTRMYP